MRTQRRDSVVNPYEYAATATHINIYQTHIWTHTECILCCQIMVVSTLGVVSYAFYTLCNTSRIMIWKYKASHQMLYIICHYKRTFQLISITRYVICSYNLLFLCFGFLYFILSLQRNGHKCCIVEATKTFT